MRLDAFEEFVHNEVSAEMEIMLSKGKEYTISNDDKLMNFKMVAAVLDRPNTLDVIMTYLQKHYFSILNYVNEGVEASDETISGRIRDARNYLLLLHAAILEEQNEGQ